MDKLCWQSFYLFFLFLFLRISFTWWWPLQKEGRVDFFLFLITPYPPFILIELNFVSVCKKKKRKFVPFSASFSSDPCSTPAPFSFLFFSFPFGELHSLAISLSLQPLHFRTHTLACHLFLILSTPLHADYNIDSKLLVTVFLSERVSRGGNGVGLVYAI